MPLRPGRERAIEKADWYDWMMALLIGILIIGYPAISFLSIPLGINGDNSRTLTIPYRAATLGLSLFMFIVAWHKKRLTLHGSIRKLFLLFWVGYFIRMAYETIEHADELTLEPSYYWAYGAGLCVVCNLVLFQKFTPAVMRLASWFVWCLALIAILAGVLFRRDELSLLARSSATEILNPISYAAAAVTLILLSGYFALQDRSRGRLVLLAAAILPAIYVLAASASRGPLLTLLVGLFFLLVHGLKQGASWKLLTGAMVVIIALPLGLNFLLSEGSALTTRFIEFYRDASGGVEVDRFVLWQSAWQQYLTNPLFGNGLEIIGVGYPHNLLIESLMVLGVGGAMVFGSFFFLNVKAALACVSSDATAWVGLLLLQHFVHAMVSGGLYCFPELWALTLLNAGVAAFSAKPQKPAQSQSSWDASIPARAN